MGKLLLLLTPSSGSRPIYRQELYLTSRGPHAASRRPQRTYLITMISHKHRFPFTAHVLGAAVPRVVRRLLGSAVFVMRAVQWGLPCQAVFVMTSVFAWGGIVSGRILLGLPTGYWCRFWWVCFRAPYEVGGRGRMYTYKKYAYMYMNIYNIHT